MASTSNPLQDLINQQFYASNPAAAFYRRFSPQMGGGGNQNYNAWLRGRQDDYFNTYLGGLGDNPEQLYTTWLDEQDPMKQFQSLAPSQRGERQSQFSPRMRRIG